MLSYISISIACCLFMMPYECLPCLFFLNFIKIDSGASTFSIVHIYLAEFFRVDPKSQLSRKIKSSIKITLKSKYVMGQTKPRYMVNALLHAFFNNINFSNGLIKT
ncbi:hypothetical protein EGW08_005474 [Elysia chlorotica]|uniref:Uncharacterized protein n=1 Tax=Elysia chlorotica TaxID=188477 RepID=A0A433TYX0_ELYCH|nr:hypothetical protein EGW08_005474 [Elysia chlorotica]